MRDLAEPRLRGLETKDRASKFTPPSLRHKKRSAVTDRNGPCGLSRVLEWGPAPVRLPVISDRLRHVLERSPILEHGRFVGPFLCYRRSLFGRRLAVGLRRSICVRSFTCATHHRHCRSLQFICNKSQLSCSETATIRLGLRSAEKGGYRKAVRSQDAIRPGTLLRSQHRCLSRT